MITLEPITPRIALIFKEVRLRALQDSPTAFSSTYAKESALPNEEWITRSVRWCSEGFIGLLAFDQGKPCGMVACHTDEHDPPRAHVISMWVAPGSRRAGVGTVLIDALKQWAASRGLHELKLMVTSVNRGAIAFYERKGFQMTGKTGPYPNDQAIAEYEMILRLSLG